MDHIYIILCIIIIHCGSNEYHIEHYFWMAFISDVSTNHCCSKINSDYRCAVFS